MGLKNDCILARLGSGREYLNLTVRMTAMTMMIMRNTPTMRLMMRVRCLLGLEGAALTGVLVAVEVEVVLSVVTVVLVDVVFSVVTVVFVDVVWDVVAGVAVDVEDV